MSAEVDHEDKTEEPTEKRLHDAVERGQVAFSREAPLFASLSAARNSGPASAGTSAPPPNSSGRSWPC